MSKVISDVNTIFTLEYLQTQKEGHILFDGDIAQISFWGPKEDSSFFKEVYNSTIYVLINKVLGLLRRCFEYIRKN